MAKVSFLLTRPTATKPTPIFAFVAFNGQRVKVYPGFSIHPEQWNKAQQRAVVTPDSLHQYTNAALDLAERKLLECYAQHRAKGQLPTAETLRALVVPVVAPAK